MLGVAAAAVLAAVLVLTLSGNHHRPPVKGHTVLAAAAGYLNVPASELRQKLREGKSIGEIAAATKGVSQHKLVEALYAERKQAIARLRLPPASERAALAAAHQQIITAVGRTRRRRGLISVAAGYLGKSEAQLRARLAAGSTLATVAAATPGRSRAGLVEALVASRRRKLALALRRKTITATEERQALEHLKRHFEREVTRQVG